MGHPVPGGYKYGSGPQGSGCQKWAGHYYDHTIYNGLPVCQSSRNESPDRGHQERMLAKEEGLRPWKEVTGACPENSKADPKKWRPQQLSSRKAQTKQGQQILN
jgi:hypothetical protein